MREETMLFTYCYFPNDIGFLVGLFMNIVELSSGEAIEIEAREPHSLIIGDLVEA